MTASVLALWLGGLALAGWLVLALSFFWTCREADDLAPLYPPAVWPEVVAVVPARNEADVIATSLTSLAAQDYPGRFRIILVDDDSADGTGDIARGLGHERLAVLSGAAFYVGCTLYSALAWCRGKGGMWKGRAQAHTKAAHTADTEGCIKP